MTRAEKNDRTTSLMNGRSIFSQKCRDIAISVSQWALLRNREILRWDHSNDLCLHWIHRVPYVLHTGTAAIGGGGVNPATLYFLTLNDHNSQMPPLKILLLSDNFLRYLASISAGLFFFNTC